jgi:pyruvate kinase
MRRAKIVCTLGPASNGVEAIKRLIDAGMDVARLNFSHGNHDGHRKNAGDVRTAAKQAGKVVAILADLSGPKIRIGVLPNDAVELAHGDEFSFVAQPGVSTDKAVSITYPPLVQELQLGDAIFADDGMMQFLVHDLEPGVIHCRVVDGGILRSKKGLNATRAGVSAAGVTDKDRVDIAFGKEIGVDCFGLSFVRSADDVKLAKEFAGDVPIVAKIEKPQAIDNLEAIADAADGMMVARGDLAVELGAEKVPVQQKRMIREMNARAKPVIVATQMLESMTTNPRPTRAEVSDVANAVIDGADALMLSAETATGKYPSETVRTMARIIEEVEESTDSTLQSAKLKPTSHAAFEHAAAHAAARAAIDLGLKAVVVYSASGRSASYVSAFRPEAAILGFSPNARVLSRMPLLWGVQPVAIDQVESPEAAIKQVEKCMLDMGLASKGDQAAMVLGFDVSKPPGSTTLQIWKIGEGG